MASEAAEKVNFATSAAKAADENAALIAALKRCATQSQSSFRSLFSRAVQGRN